MRNVPHRCQSVGNTLLIIIQHNSEALFQVQKSQFTQFCATNVNIK